MVLQISTTQEHADVHIVDNSVDNQNAPPLHVVVEPLEISMNLGASNGSGRWSSTMELVGWARGSGEVEERKGRLQSSDEASSGPRAHPTNSALYLYNHSPIGRS